MERSYLFRDQSEDGWSSKRSWSTAYVWMANDIGFGGVYGLMFLFGYFLAEAWKDFICRGNQRAYLALVIFALFIFYSPMNMQLTQTVDYYVTSIAWLSAWWMRRWATR